VWVWTRFSWVRVGAGVAVMNMIMNLMFPYKGWWIS